MMANYTVEKVTLDGFGGMRPGPLGMRIVIRPYQTILQTKRLEQEARRTILAERSETVVPTILAR
jgi:hypothetical protein